MDTCVELKSIMRNTPWHHDVKVSELLTEVYSFRLWGVVFCLCTRVFLSCGAGSSLGHRTNIMIVHTNWVFSGTKFAFLHHAGRASSSFQWCTLLWHQKIYCQSIKKSFKLDEQWLFVSSPWVLCTAIYLRPRHSFHISAKETGYKNLMMGGTENKVTVKEIKCLNATFERLYTEQWTCCQHLQSKTIRSMHCLGGNIRGDYKQYSMIAIFRTMRVKLNDKAICK